MGNRAKFVQMHEGSKPFERTPKIISAKNPPLGPASQGRPAQPPMTAAIDTGLQDLKRQHPEWEPWLAVVQEVLGETTNPEWDACVPVRTEPQQSKVPLLAGITLAFDKRSVHRLLEKLIRIAHRSGTPEMATLEPVLHADLDFLNLFKASLCQDNDRLKEIAADLGADSEAFQASAERPPWTITAADGEQSERTMISGDKLQRLRYIYRRRRLRAQQYERDAWRVAQGSDAILFLAPGVVGYSIAERLGIPCAEIGIFPITRTRAFRSFLLGRGKDRGPFFNWLLWHLSERTWQLTQRTMTNRQRREVLGLPPLPLWDPFRRQALEGMPLYYAYSPTVLPRPVDWPARVHVTGYYFSDPPPSWRPPSALVQFLRSGPAPVCIGFGSMPITAVERTLRVVLEALDLSGQRGILVSGWKSIGKGHHFSERVFRTEAIPHGWLFPVWQRPSTTAAPARLARACEAEFHPSSARLHPTNSAGERSFTLWASDQLPSPTRGSRPGDWQVRSAKPRRTWQCGSGRPSWANACRKRMALGEPSNSSSNTSTTGGLRHECPEVTTPCQTVSRSR